MQTIVHLHVKYDVCLPVSARGILYYIFINNIHHPRVPIVFVATIDSVPLQLSTPIQSQILDSKRMAIDILDDDALDHRASIVLLLSFRALGLVPSARRLKTRCLYAASSITHRRENALILRREIHRNALVDVRVDVDQGRCPDSN
jgi:hypothetical protein